MVSISSILRNPFAAAWRWYRPALAALAVIVLVPAASIAADPAGQFETPPVLHAKDLVPATLLSGEGFNVDDAVPTDGLMAMFTLHTELGTLQVHGIELLRIRVAEVPAMLELAHESKTKVFAQALARTGAEPIKAAGQMVMHPVDTVKGLPGGVGRFFGRVGLGAQRIKEAATEPEEASAGEKASEVAKRTGQTTRDILGYEQERLELAHRLHVDPYTTNPILSKQLDEFALVAFRAHVRGDHYHLGDGSGFDGDHCDPNNFAHGLGHAQGGSDRAQPENARRAAGAARDHQDLHAQYGLSIERADRIRRGSQRSRKSFGRG